MGTGRLIQKNVINLKNEFDLHRKVLEDIDCGRKIEKKIFPLNYSLEIEKSKKILQSDNGDAKAQGALE